MDKDIYNQKIDFFNDQLRKIGSILSNQIEGTGILLTIAGLLSFLLPLVITGNEYLSHFLIYTFPFLIISIIAYYPASLRVSSIIKGHPFAPIGSNMELEILKNQTQYLELIWRKSVENHDSVLFCNGLSKSFIYGYIFSMISNLYIFVFYGKPNLYTSLVLFITSCLVVMVLFTWPKLKSEKNKIIE